MKHNKQFWFWLFVISPLFLGMSLTTAQEFNLDTAWLWGAFATCVVVSVMGVTVILFGKQNRRAASSDAKEQLHNRPRQARYSKEFVCIVGVVLLQWLASTGILPQLVAGWLTLGLISILLWFLLVPDVN